MTERSGRVAVVPMEGAPPAPSYIAWHVAEKLDTPVDAMLAGDVEVATRHFDITTAA